jgi:Na+-translocating ferredoxin:NAD+ oxidoreductase RnfA subunit
MHAIVSSKDLRVARRSRTRVTSLIVVSRVVSRVVKRGFCMVLGILEEVYSGRGRAVAVVVAVAVAAAVAVVVEEKEN